jgi:cysteine synthase B
MPSILDTVGHTPLVELHGFDVPSGVRLFAKLEGQNPTGSVKDRIVRDMLLRAADEGALPPGGTVVEASTGNTAIALAMIGRVLGYHVCVVMPENVFAEIPRALAVYGAETHWVPADLGVKGAIEEAKRIAAETGAFFLDQFGNPSNPQAHYENTAPEILADLPHVDAFVAGLGTGGTLMGVGRRLKEAGPHTKVIAVEPHPGNQLQGLKSLADGFRPSILDLAALDAKILVRGRHAFLATRKLMLRQGILAGVSSGAVLHAGLRWASRMSKGNVVLLFADGGWKYLSTPCVEGDLPEDEGESLDDVIWW